MLLFTHELTVTMQSVVTRLAPITLERKINHRENKQKQQIIRTISETDRIPHTKIAEINVRTYQDTYVPYARHVAAERSTEETASYPQE